MLRLDWQRTLFLQVEKIPSISEETEAAICWGTVPWGCRNFFRWWESYRNSIETRRSSCDGSFHAFSVSSRRSCLQNFFRGAFFLFEVISSLSSLNCLDVRGESMKAVVRYYGDRNCGGIYRIVYVFLCYIEMFICLVETAHLLKTEV